MLHKCNGVLMHVLRPTKVDKKNSSKLTEFALCALISFDSHGKAAGKKKKIHMIRLHLFFFFGLFIHRNKKKKAIEGAVCRQTQHVLSLGIFSQWKEKKKILFSPSRFFYHQVIRVYVFSLAAMWAIPLTHRQSGSQPLGAEFIILAVTDKNTKQNTPFQDGLEKQQQQKKNSKKPKTHIHIHTHE